MFKYGYILYYSRYDICNVMLTRVGAYRSYTRVYIMTPGTAGMYLITAYIYVNVYISPFIVRVCIYIYK